MKEQQTLFPTPYRTHLNNLYKKLLRAIRMKTYERRFVSVASPTSSNSQRCASPVSKRSTVEVCIFSRTNRQRHHHVLLVALPRRRRRPNQRLYRQRSSSKVLHLRLVSFTCSSSLLCCWCLSRIFQIRAPATSLFDLRLTHAFVCRVCSGNSFWYSHTARTRAPAHTLSLIYSSCLLLKSLVCPPSSG